MPASTCRTALFVSWLLALAAPALAQSPHADPVPTNGTRAGASGALVTWAAAAALDQAITFNALRDRPGELRERNPLVRRFDSRPGLMLAAGGALDAASGWAAWHLVGRKHPRMAMALFFGAAAYRAFLVGHNLQQMHRARGAAPAR